MDDFLLSALHEYKEGKLNEEEMLTALKKAAV